MFISLLTCAMFGHYQDGGPGPWAMASRVLEGELSCERVSLHLFQRPMADQEFDFDHEIQQQA